MKVILVITAGFILAASSFGQSTCNSSHNVTTCTDQSTGHSVETTCYDDGSCHTREYYGEGKSFHEYRACGKAIKALKKNKGKPAEQTYQNDVNQACAGMKMGEKWVK